MTFSVFTAGVQRNAVGIFKGFLFHMIL